MNPIFSNLLITLKGWNDYSGTATREEYSHFLIVALPLYYYIIPMLSGWVPGGLNNLLYAVLFLFFLPLQIRRLRYLGMNGVIALLIFIPLIGLMIAIVISLAMNPQTNPSTPNLVNEGERSGQAHTIASDTVRAPSKIPRLLILLIACAVIGFSPLLVGWLGKKIFCQGSRDCFFDVLHWLALFTLPFAALAFIIVGIIIMNGGFKK